MIRPKILILAFLRHLRNHFSKVIYLALHCIQKTIWMWEFVLTLKSSSSFLLHWLSQKKIKNPTNQSVSVDSWNHIWKSIEMRNLLVEKGHVSNISSWLTYYLCYDNNNNNKSIDSCSSYILFKISRTVCFTKLAPTISQRPIIVCCYLLHRTATTLVR